MTKKTKIEWTEMTWNPVTGCTKVSPGCKNCYAETMARRLEAMGARGYENGFKLMLMPERLADNRRMESGIRTADSRLLPTVPGYEGMFRVGCIDSVGAFVPPGAAYARW